MRFFAPHVQAGETAVTTSAEYDELFRQYQQAYTDWLACFPNKPGLKEATEHKAKINAEFRERRLPYVLIAICPFCHQEIWQKAMVFSFKDDFWYRTYSDGKDVHNDSLCPHLFCVDGALHLNGHIPTEVTGAVYSPISHNYAIHMAAEVPFVKPRLLEIATMVAVMHSLPVADKYTAYPIVYFAEKQPPLSESFCIPWGCVEQVEHAEYYVTTRRRQDYQVYELDKWVEQGKLLWVDPENETELLSAPTHVFPYGAVNGRDHPYIIEDGVIKDLPDPIETPPVTETETWR